MCKNIETKTEEQPPSYVETISSSSTQQTPQNPYPNPYPN